MKYVIVFSILKSFFFSNLFAEVGGQELEPPIFLPELLNTPERILSKNVLSFIFYSIALQWGITLAPEHCREACS